MCFSIIAITRSNSLAKKKNYKKQFYSDGRGGPIQVWCKLGQTKNNYKKKPRSNFVAAINESNQTHNSVMFLVTVDNKTVNLEKIKIELHLNIWSSNALILTFS